VAVAIDDVFDQKLDAVNELVSQVYEGGANGSAEYVATVPPASDPAARRAWLKQRWEGRQGGEAQRFRDTLIKWYGDERGRAVKFAETFEICEYGRKPAAAELKRLFPFFSP
jgi:hypothetical protein